MVPRLGAPSVSGDRGSTLHTASAAGMDELSREGGLQTLHNPHGSWQTSSVPPAASLRHPHVTVLAPKGETETPACSP